MRAWNVVNNSQFQARPDDPHFEISIALLIPEFAASAADRIFDWAQIGASSSCASYTKTYTLLSSRACRAKCRFLRGDARRSFRSPVRKTYPGSRNLLANSGCRRKMHTSGERNSNSAEIVETLELQSRFRGLRLSPDNAIGHFTLVMVYRSVRACQGDAELLELVTSAEGGQSRCLEIAETRNLPLAGSRVSTISRTVEVSLTRRMHFATAGRSSPKGCGYPG